VQSTTKARRWVAWMIAGVWVATAFGVWVCTRIHPSTTANVSVRVRQISFATSARKVLGPSNNEQLLVSGLQTLRIQFNAPRTVTIDRLPKQTTVLELDGDASAACSFYQIRSSGLDLSEDSRITLGATTARSQRSFHVNVHGPLSVDLTSGPTEPGLTPSFSCTRMHVQGGPPQDVEASLAPEGGESIFFSTSHDTRLDFDLTHESEIGDTQVPILNEIRFSEIDPRTSEEKTVLLKAAPGYKNEVSFEKLGATVTLDDADLLVVLPKDDFYLRQFTVKDGIQLSMHGVVRDIRVGAGTSDLESRMPSLFDALDNQKRVLGLIPALVALILGVLEKMGGLTQK
jgi:hypothetical protein